ncbi:hypothetical protein Q2V62_16970 [Escherichia coli]|uniref:hypothetical protein n=1 Tax=Escherichia coli TaxID=562 RepID=UPI002666B3F9|nr:hypothetical protein [Escherichia coli]MDO2860600.1 hypothetical protein [Escherichia coli]
MEKIDIVADQLQLDRALNKLIHNLVEESQLTLGETLSAWELCEKLSMQQFMALKKNVYFADLLRAVEISLPLRQTLHVDGAEIRQVETEFEEKPEVARDEPVMSSHSDLGKRKYHKVIGIQRQVTRRDHRHSEW